MKKLTQHPILDEQAALKRIAILEDQFRGVSDVLSELTANLDRPDSHPPKAVMAKLMELQSIHFTIIKAHEVFNEKFRTTAVDDGVDYNKIRTDVGRQLDRIRAALLSKGIFENP